MKAFLMSGSLNIITRVEVSIRTPWPLIHFIPRIACIPSLGNTTRSTVYSRLLIEMHTSLTIWLVEIWFPATLIYSNHPLIMLGYKCLTHKWMRCPRIKQNNNGMLVHKKCTRSNNFTGRNLFNSGIVYMSLTHIRITLLLVVLLGIGAISCPMAGLVAVPTRKIAGWNIRTSLSCATLW